MGGETEGRLRLAKAPFTRLNRFPPRGQFHGWARRGPPSLFLLQDLGRGKIRRGA